MLGLQFKHVRIAHQAQFVSVLDFRELSAQGFFFGLCQAQLFLCPQYSEIGFRGTDHQLLLAERQLGLGGVIQAFGAFITVPAIHAHQWLGDGQIIDGGIVVFAGGGAAGTQVQELVGG